MTILGTDSRAVSTHGPAKSGYVVEAIIEGKLAWLILPDVLERYTFTFEFAMAQVFDTRQEAINYGSSVQCGYFGGREGSIAIVLLCDEYRALVASDLVIAERAK